MLLWNISILTLLATQTIVHCETTFEEYIKYCPMPLVPSSKKEDCSPVITDTCPTLDNQNKCLYEPFILGEHTTATDFVKHSHLEIAVYLATWRSFNTSNYYDITSTFSDEDTVPPLIQQAWEKYSILAETIKELPSTHLLRHTYALQKNNTLILRENDPLLYLLIKTLRPVKTLAQIVAKNFKLHILLTEVYDRKLFVDFPANLPVGFHLSNVYDPATKK